METAVNLYKLFNRVFFEIVVVNAVCHINI